MKLLSIAIPCYNSQDYMENCIESLLVGGEEVEILIVDDGSSDRTAEIADDYARKYPTIVKAIHQENGGHGEAVNAGIRNATGLYFKVVDSDDWVTGTDPQSAAIILEAMGADIIGANCSLYTQWLDFTPAKVPGLAAVQYVDCKTAAGQAAHVEAGGWWTRSGSGAHSLSN